MITTLYLARHGETQWNKTLRFQGQLDSELTQVGKLQSKNIADSLSDIKIDLIVSSTLGRAVNSALICQQQLKSPVEHSVELIERNLGPWQGRYIQDIKTNKNYPELMQQYTDLNLVDDDSSLNGKHIEVVDGFNISESAITCAVRVYNALETLADEHNGKNILVIFHGEALRCFLAKLGHHSSISAYELIDNGSVFQVTYQHSEKRFNLITN
jgi:broad specificity phosphatase PhoE